MIQDYLLLIFRNFSRRRLRGMLTIIGIFIGIMAVVALVSLTQGMQNAITGEFQKIGTNRIIVTAGGAMMGPLGTEMTTAKLKDKDVQTIIKVRGVDEAVGILLQTARVDFNDEIKYLNVAGAPTNHEQRKLIDEISFFQIAQGRSVKESDKYRADIGYKVAEDLFKKKIEIGGRIKINGKSFEVVGTRKKAGTGIHDLILKIPIDTARELFNETEKISMIFVTTKKDFNVTKVAEEIKKDLRKERDVKEGEEDFTVTTAEQAIGTFKQIISVLQIVLVGIAAVSLIVGGVGIMNAMYTAVLERTKEIGIMKAVGAKSSQIMALFLIESGIIGLIGGLIGIILGIIIGKTVQYIANNYGITLIPVINFWIIFSVLAFSFLIGSISGVFPAFQASKLKPIEAIRRY